MSMHKLSFVLWLLGRRISFPHFQHQIHGNQAYLGTIPFLISSLSNVCFYPEEDANVSLDQISQLIFSQVTFPSTMHSEQHTHKNYQPVLLTGWRKKQLWKIWGRAVLLIFK